MRIWRSLDAVPADLGRTVVTIGNFDGVHLGHQHVVRRAREVAAELGIPDVVAVTFDPHPIAVLRPEHAPPTLTTVETRVRLLDDAGVDDVLVIPFSRELADWSPERLVVLEFPSMDDAKAWWSSPEYKGPKALRQECAETRSVMVEGV